MPLLADARKKAKEMKIEGTLQLATGGKKKLVLKLPSGSKVQFGQKGSVTYLEGASAEKRAAYKARHGAIKLASGQKAINKKNSPAYLADRILW